MTDAQWAVELVRRAAESHLVATPLLWSAPLEQKGAECGHGARPGGRRFACGQWASMTTRTACDARDRGPGALDADES